MHPIVTSTHSFRRIENEDFILEWIAILNSFLPCQYTVSESRAFNWFILWFRQRNKCTVYRITEKHKYLLRSLFQPCRSHFLGRDKRCYKSYEDIGPNWSRAQSPLTGKEKFPFLTQFGISKSQGSWNSTKRNKRKRMNWFQCLVERSATLFKAIENRNRYSSRSLAVLPEATDFELHSREKVIEREWNFNSFWFAPLVNIKLKLAF